MKSVKVWIISAMEGHSLRGLCGLKSQMLPAQSGAALSQPARAVWIEINVLVSEPLRTYCHSLRGLCGLKFLQFLYVLLALESQPARAVWIEILRRSMTMASSESQPARAVWIEI